MAQCLGIAVINWHNLHLTSIPRGLARLAGWLAASLLATALPGQEDAPRNQPDRVRLVAPTSTSSVDLWKTPFSEMLLGEIQQFDDQQLLLIDQQGQQRLLAAEQVAEVVPRWRNAAAAEAHRLFLERDYPQVISTVPAALQSGLPQWQQRFLIAELVQSVSAVGNPRVAGIYFLNLAQSRAPPLFYDQMPLCWTPQEPTPEVRRQAQQWLNQNDSEEARLLGASWLLLGEQHAEAARVIGELRSAKNSVVAQYAVAQSWRMVPPPQTSSELPRWFEFRDKLLPPLQLGPTEFLAERLMRIGQADLAIGQWLRIATMHKEQYHRAAAALELAKAQLEKLGRNEEAQGLQPWILQLRGVSAEN